MSMEGFTASQIAHMQATTLDLYERGPLRQIGIDKKPTLKKFEAKKKTYAGAKEAISIGVKFDRGNNGVNDGMAGFSHTQKVGFYNPGNGLRASYVWREHHMGGTISETQLKAQGILVGDEFGTVQRRRNDPGLIVLANMMDEFNADIMEQRDVSMNRHIWSDGTLDTSALHGLRTFIRDIPTLGVVGGLSAATHTKWRNRSRTAAFAAHATFDPAWGGGAVTSSPTNGGALVEVLEDEWLQLARFGGMPDCSACGSDFLSAYRREQRANGMYSQSGFMGTQDAGMGDLKFKGVMLEYDPTLDQMGLSKRAYFWDSSHLFLKTLEGDWMRKRNAARPYDQFIVNQSITATGQMVCDQRDCSLVIDIN